MADVTKEQWNAAARGIFDYEDKGVQRQIGSDIPRLTWERACEERLYIAHHCFAKALIAFQSANLTVDGEDAWKWS